MMMRLSGIAIAVLASAISTIGAKMLGDTNSSVEKHRKNDELGQALGLQQRPKREAE